MITVDDRAQFKPDGVLYLFKKFDLGLRGLSSGGVFHIEIRSQFFVRYAVQLNTLVTLASGLKVEMYGHETIYFDHFSALGIARSLVETYLNFTYIYTTSRSSAETAFRFKCWHLYGLLEQINTVNHRPSMRKRHGKAISNTESEIIRLSNEIKSDHIFPKLTEKQKKEILNGRSWRTKSRTEIAKEANIDETLINTYFSQTSSYLHTSSLSLLQNYGKGPEPHRRTTYLAAQVGALIGLKFLSDLIGFYPTAKLHLTEAEIHEIEMGAKQLGLKGQ